MKFHLMFVFSVLILSVSLSDDIVTLGGKKYKDVKVTNTDSFGIKVLVKTGVEYIPYAQMTDADKTKYGYDPKKESDALAEIQKQKEAKERKITEEKIWANSFHFRGKSIQILNGGVILEGELWTRAKWLEKRKNDALIKKIEDALEQQQKMLEKLSGFNPRTLEGQKKKLDVEIESADAGLKARERVIQLMEETCPMKGVYFIAGITETLADVEPWEGDVLYAGLFKYVNTQGAKKTIRAFATKPELAEKMFLNSDKTLQIDRTSSQ